MRLPHTVHLKVKEDGGYHYGLCGCRDSIDLYKHMNIVLMLNYYEIRVQSFLRADWGTYDGIRYTVCEACWNHPNIQLAKLANTEL